MNTFIQLAWRNLWRNKRRTLITGASIFFGVIFSTVMTSMQEGSYAQMIKTVVNSYSGYIQIHKAGYSDDKSVNNSLDYSQVLKEKLNSIKSITTVTPRMETYALASGKELTKGVMVLGIAPSSENNITSLSKRIVQGHYLKDGDKGVVVGSSLAKYMQLSVGDTLVLLGQGYHGMSAAGEFRVEGIVKLASPELNRRVVYMDINNCCDFLSAYHRATSIVVMTNKMDDVASTVKSIKKSLGKGYEVKDWKEINTVLLSQIESDRSSGYIIKGILYLIIAFGIFSTVMMMTLERKKEFGVLIAIGMKKRILGSMLLVENILIGFLGSITGILLSIPIVWYYVVNPIHLTGQTAESFSNMGWTPVMYFSSATWIFLTQAIIILCFNLLIAIYPVVHIKRMKINKALHG